MCIAGYCLNVSFNETVFVFDDIAVVTYSKENIWQSSRDFQVQQTVKKTANPLRLCKLVNKNNIRIVHAV